MTALPPTRGSQARAGCTAPAGLLALAALLLACNTFDPGVSGVDPSTDPPRFVPGGGGAPAPFGPPTAPSSPSENAPPGSIGLPGCAQCGAFCADCGRGCECKEGHTPFDPPPWKVPFSPVGEDGWKDSTRALCAGMGSVIDTRIWVGRDGVYAMVGGDARALSDVGGIRDDDAGVAGDPAFGVAFGARTRVLHDEGAGWALRADLASASTESGLTGFPNSGLILYGGRGDDESACPLGVVSGSTFTCQPVVGTVQSAVAISEQLAFALTGSRDMLVFDGTSWHSTTLLPAPANAIWASESELIAVGPDGTVMRFQEGSWSRESVGRLARLTAVWGTSGQDLWAGAFDGALFHFDGSGWAEVAQLGGVSCKAQPPIEHIWGSGTALWVATASQLARWNGEQLESFGNWSCASLGASDRITGLWGTAADDVFISVSNGDELLGPCGGAFVVHFDGERFHRF